MELDIKKQLEELIKEQRERIPRLKENDSLYCPYSYEEEDDRAYTKWIENTKRFLNIHFRNDKFIEQFENLGKGVYALTPKIQQKLLAILEAFLNHPTIIEKTKINNPTNGININNNITNTNTQSQQQSQQQSIDILIKALEEELSVSQLKEIKQLVREENGDLEKAKPKVIEKLKSFGEGLISNILANIITNPSIWSQLG